MAPQFTKPSPHERNRGVFNSTAAISGNRLLHLSSKTLYSIGAN